MCRCARREHRAARAACWRAQASPSVAGAVTQARKDTRPMIVGRARRLVSAFGSASSPPAGPLIRLTLEPAGLLQFALHAPAELVIPVEPAERCTDRLRGELRPPQLSRQGRAADRRRLVFPSRLAPALAIFRIAQIIDVHSLPRRLEPTTAGRRSPVRADVPNRRHRSCVDTGGLGESAARDGGKLSRRKAASMRTSVSAGNAAEFWLGHGLASWRRYANCASLARPRESSATKRTIENRAVKIPRP